MTSPAPWPSTTGHAYTSRRRFKAPVALAVAVVAFGVALVMTVVVTIIWFFVGRTPPPVSDTLIQPDHCVAVANEYKGTMTPEQAGNAAIIVGESIRRGLPARAASIALVTAWQESSLRNLNYGDRDSLGLFQQRPSQGWGTPEQIMDPWYAAGKFYDEMVKVKNWQTRELGDVAQAVQRSAYPDLYAKHESPARAWASNLRGETMAQLTCVANEGNGGGGDELVTLLTTIWGDKLTITNQGTVIDITAPDQTTAWAVAQISMAGLAGHGLTSIKVGCLQWTHKVTSPAQWVNVTMVPPVQPTPSASATGASPQPEPGPTCGGDTQVIVTLR